VEVLDLLPARHYSGSAAKSHVSPHCVEITVVDNTDVVGLARKRGELVTAEIVVVVCHRITEATDNRFGNIYIEVSSYCNG
jgi:hypothetical protein